MRLKNIFAVMAVVVGTAVYVLQEGGTPLGGKPPLFEALPPAVVEVSEINPEQLKVVYAIPGTLQAEMSVELKSEIEGLIAKIGFKEGQRVESGEILFQLSDSEQKAFFREMEASLALAKAIHARTLVLAERQIVSASQLDSAHAELAVAKARVERAKVNLERTTIRAPFNGFVGARSVDVGDRISSEDVLVQVDALDRLQLSFSVVESYSARVRPGISVTVVVAPFPDKLFSGEVYFVSPTLDESTRRLPIKAWVPNPDQQLRPGLFAKIWVELSERTDALMIPESALVYDLEGAFVWVVDEENRAHRNPVDLGFQREGEIEVVKGLAPGSRVVASGVHKVADGFLVAPVEMDSGGGS
jgi:membrane fusion protein (multidrug efflux system)